MHMQTIQLKSLVHRNQPCIALLFAKDPELNKLLKAAGAHWSHTQQCWWIPRTAAQYHKLQQAVEGKALLEKGAAQLAAPAEKSGAASPLNHSLPAVEKKAIARVKPASGIVSSISGQNLAALEACRQHLILKSYSPSTMRTYLNELAQFMQVLGHTEASSFSASRLKDYLQYCHETLQLSENTLHSRINALKFYYEQVLGKEKFFWEIPRPKKKQQLPKVFNQDEIAAIINSVQNKKHKVMLMLAYSGGLRVSEVVAIKTYHIDSKRMTIFIAQGKGKKDRIVALSPVLLVMLREYASTYEPDKDGFLFPGILEGTMYSTRSLQEILQKAKKKAGITRPGSIHSLRHSFATHLVEKGTDVSMIQKLLGHNDIKTTLLYLHTSNKDLIKIVSPLDDLKLT